MIPGLARHLIESTAFALVVALLPLFMRRRRAAERHAVWVVAASKFALPAGLFSAAGAHLSTLIPAHHLPVVRPAFLSSFVSQRSSAPLSTAALSEAPILLLVLWLGGAVVMLSLWLRQQFAPSNSSAAVLDSEKESLVRMQQRIGFRRPVKLRSSRSRIEPRLTGVWHATITIPQGLSARLTPREFAAVLLHELAHAKRSDNLSGAFVHALVCVFWFHPLLWWIERRLIIERELACDEMVVQYGAAPEEYIAGILKACGFHLAVVGFCRITGSDLKNRMEAIMSYRPHNLLRRTPKLWVGVLASAMTIIPLAYGFLGMSALLGQETKDSKPASGPVAPKPTIMCVFNGKSYPEGTVIGHQNEAGQQMCVRVGSGGYWTSTSDAVRERSRNVIILPPEKPAPPCEIKPSPSAELCACQSGIFSIGSIVDSANGKLYCDKGKWRAATRTELGLK